VIQLHDGAIGGVKRRLPSLEIALTASSENRQSKFRLFFAFFAERTSHFRWSKFCCVCELSHITATTVIMVLSLSNQLEERGQLEY
jgi:hypothetical protein